MKSLIEKYLRNKSQSKSIFTALMRSRSLTKALPPHLFVEKIMKAYDNGYSDKDRSVHGKVFEFVIGEVLAQNKIGPLYFQAELHYVPLAKFDWLLYHPETPVSISCKTSPREKWKQAAYEGQNLKKVYPQAVNYLVILEDLSNSEEKIKKSAHAIDHFVIATDQSFSKAINEIKKIKFEEAQNISPIADGISIPKI